MNTDEIADGYIKYALAWKESESDSEKYLDYYIALTDYIVSDPKTALDIMEEICNQSHDDDVLINLGSGPIEDWFMTHSDPELDYLNTHRDEHFEYLLKIARRCPGFRQALRSTVRYGLPEDKWTEILKVSGRTK